MNFSYVIKSNTLTSYTSISILMLDQVWVSQVIFGEPDETVLSQDLEVLTYYLNEHSKLSPDRMETRKFLAGYLLGKGYNLDPKA